MKLGIGELDKIRLTPNFKTGQHSEVDSTQTCYQNEDTCDCFAFEFQAAAEKNHETSFPVSLIIKFLRPSYFIHVAKLNLDPFDPLRSDV